MDLELQVSDAALAELAKVGFDPVFGARPLKRAIQQRIENPLSKLLLEGAFPPKSVISVTVNPGAGTWGVPVQRCAAGSSRPRCRAGPRLRLCPHRSCE